MAALNAAALYDKLINPDETLSAGALLDRFSYQVIEVKLKGLGALAHLPNALAKVRGAMGRVMLEGASDAVRREAPCDWTPCCASEIFFAEKPSVDIGLKGQLPQIIKPFALSLERCGRQDLLVRMTIFGFAVEWVPMALQALVSALRDRVDWQLLSGGHYFVPKHIEIGGTHIKDRTLKLDEAIPQTCIMQFQTPIDSERTDLIDHPERILEKLYVRVALAGRWFGIRLEHELPDLSDFASGLDLDFQGPVHTDLVRVDSGRNAQHGFKEVSVCDLVISGDLASLWPFLRIGEAIHIGRAAVKGFGRYSLLVE